MKKLLKGLLCAVSIILVLVLLLLELPFNFTFGSKNKQHVSVMGDNIENMSAHVTDIAMLGAHDAFSSKVGMFSAVDPAEDEDSMLNAGYGWLVRGFTVRFARAQNKSAKGLLRGGVRYLDVRLSWADGKWYNKHGLLGAPFEDNLKETIAFLNDNAGEFIIFDMQHTYTGESSFEALFNYLNEVKVDGKSLIDHIHYDASATELKDLTYGDVTENGASAGVVVLIPPEGHAAMPAVSYDRDENCRSVWHNKMKDGEMLSAIAAEHEKIAATDEYDGMIRVNQAQKTLVLSGSNMGQIVFGWSLMDMANRFNKKLSRHDDFSAWLETTPVFMVDFATSRHCDSALRFIGEHNKAL